MSHNEQLANEQTYVHSAYTTLDTLRVDIANKLEAVRSEGAAGTHQGRSERDAYATLYEDRLTQLWSVEERLVFGRLDAADGSTLYVGRLGLKDEDETRLLIDWRAPVATPFYQATAHTPMGIARRRHIGLTERTVTSIEDDVLDADATEKLGLTQLYGEGALMAAVSASRSSHMGDIVATIQAEQDTIIRDDPAGVLVVQGGPGTGKTAVALHRTAFLIYAEREKLSHSGVLLIGPSAHFLTYIEQVLPALGETGVVMMTLGGLLPGVYATVHDEGETARVKGDERMAEVCRRAVESYQVMPEHGITVKYDNVPIKVTAAQLQSAKDAAAKSAPLHNEARVVFLKRVVNYIAEQYLHVTHTFVEPEERAELMHDIRSDARIRQQLNRLWLPLTPQLVLRGLYALPYRLDAAAPELSEREKMALWRDLGDRDEWTVEDVPLLDEVAELIGDGSAADDFAPERDPELAYAKAVLDMLGSDGTVSASQLANRTRGVGLTSSLAERASRDRTWAYGHVVIDEAQELTHMAWRAVLRRVPSKSLTAVGDVAQTHHVGGAVTWESALEPLLGDRFRVHELTVNYRTPSKIMDMAHRFADAQDLPVTRTTSVREGDNAPVIERSEELVERSVELFLQRQSAMEQGRIALVVPDADVSTYEAVLARLQPGGDALGDLLHGQGALMGVTQAKGLEFDEVIVADPVAMARSGRWGDRDVYVALTRATQYAHVVLQPGQSLYESLS